MNYLLLILLPCLFCLSCGKEEEQKPAASYNGFKVDGTVYKMDTLERDFSYTAGALRIHSKDNTGGLIYMRRGGQIWPSADGVYQFTVRHNASDTTEVKICFSPDALFEEYCSMSGGSGISTTLTITIAKGKWTISLPPTQIMDNSIKTLEISASE